MNIIYQILSFIINVVGIFILMALFFILPLSLAAPAMWFPTFILAAIILYTWFSGRFRHKVLQKQEAVQPSLRDWIRVNGFVAIFFCFLNIPTTIAVLMSPLRFADAMRETLKQFGEKYEQSFKPENLTAASIVMLIYFIVLLVHVLWTFSLMKKHRNFFQ